MRWVWRLMGVSRWLAGRPVNWLAGCPAARLGSAPYALGAGFSHGCRASYVRTLEPKCQGACHAGRDPSTAALGLGRPLSPVQNPQCGAACCSMLQQGALEGRPPHSCQEQCWASSEPSPAACFTKTDGPAVLGARERCRLHWFGHRLGWCPTPKKRMGRTGLVPFLFFYATGEELEAIMASNPPVEVAAGEVPLQPAEPDKPWRGMQLLGAEEEGAVKAESEREEQQQPQRQPARA